tara:strand:- start:1592 stop:1696 length:105 start_codon:yes stop_codon:yes gene_type:complete
MTNEEIYEAMTDEQKAMANAVENHFKQNPIDLSK